MRTRWFSNVLDHACSTDKNSRDRGVARNGQRNEAALSCSQNMNSSGNLLVFTVHVFTREGGEWDDYEQLL